MSWKDVKVIRGFIKSTIAKANELMKASFESKSNGTIENRRVFQQFGLQSNPEEETEVIALRQGSTIWIIAGDNKKYRMELDKNDVVLYSSEKNFIKMKGAGGIEVNSDKSVIVSSNNIKLGGETDLDTLVTSKVLNLIASHIHTLNSDGTIAASATLIPLTTSPIYKTSILEAK